MSVRQFNQRAASLDHTVVLCISADLPFAQQRFCGAEGIAKVVMLSMMRDRHLAKDYGVLLEDGPLAGLTAEAVVVMAVDRPEERRVGKEGVSTCRSRWLALQ